MAASNEVQMSCGLDRKIERSGSDSWCRDSTLDCPPEDYMHFCGWRGCVVGRGAGTCGIEGVFGSKSAAHDCAQISSSEQVLGEMAKLIGFIMAPEETALEQREIDNMANVSVELERVDDGESPKRQDFEFECENGGKRDWCESVPVDGNRSVVETLAQNWTPLDREVQREWADRHQRTCALLGRSRSQKGLLGDLRECLSTSVVVATSLLERGRDSKSTDGRIRCRRRYPKFVGTQMVSQNLCNNLQDGYMLFSFVGNGSISRNLGKLRPFP